MKRIYRRGEIWRWEITKSGEMETCDIRERNTMKRIRLQVTEKEVERCDRKMMEKNKGRVITGWGER